MAWQDKLHRVTIGGRQLIGASFRGVPFYVENAEYSGGRRTAPHEFPFRDEPWVEDLGKKATTFPVEGYVLGDDYVDQRDKLREALEDSVGPGELIHPYYGRRSAICAELRISERADEGRMARFSIQFQETPAQPPTPSETPDFNGLIDIDADDALAAARAAFEDGYDIFGQPGFAIASTTAAIETLSDGLDGALAPILNVTQDAARLSADLEIMTAEASALARSPAELLNSLTSALGNLANAALASPLSVLHALASAADIDFGPEPLGETATHELERANRTLLISAVRRVLIIEAARLAPRGDYESVDYAIQTRDQLADQLEAEAATADDATYPALMQLRADILQAVPPPGTFARVLTIERPVPVPSLVLTYQLYGSVDAEDDVVGRNRPAHPGFMSGTLEVLSDVG